MYITKHDREIIKYIDDYLNEIGLPKGFSNWIDSFKINLGLKKKNLCHCTICDREYQTTKKINEYDICPYCLSKLLIKSSRIKHFETRQWLNTIQPYEDKYGEAYIIRSFVIGSWQSYNSQKVSNCVLEAARQLVYKSGGLGLSICKNTIYKNLSGYLCIGNWKEYDYWKPQQYFDLFIGKYYSNNIDEVLQPKYLSLKPYLDNTSFINICDTIDALNTNNYVFELLIKSKLYYLATRYYEFKKGKFEDTFGINKSYLPFMQEFNITIDELRILKKIKIKDIDLIRYLNNFSWRLDSLLKYCKPYDLYNYKLEPMDVHEYLDYLDFAEQLHYNLSDKKILYPQNLKEEHDRLQNLVEVTKNKKITRKIKNRYNKIKNNIYQNKKYVIYPAKSVEEMIEESSQQNNCVKTYAERVAEGKCDIYFMRLAADPTKSLVTVEVKNNTVVQQRIKNNMDTTPEQKRFLRQWEKKILKGMGGNQ